MDCCIIYVLRLNYFHANGRIHFHERTVLNILMTISTEEEERGLNQSGGKTWRVEYGIFKVPRVVWEGRNGSQAGGWIKD